MVLGISLGKNYTQVDSLHAHCHYLSCLIVYIKYRQEHLGKDGHHVLTCRIATVQGYIGIGQRMQGDEHFGIKHFNTK